MVKIFLVGAIVLLLAGCGAQPIKINTSVKETYVPIMYSPAPPDIQRPILPIQQITDDELKQDGMVVKYYKATIITLIGYSKELQKALDKYGEINKAYKAEADKIKEKLGNKATDLPKE